MARFLRFLDGLRDPFSRALNEVIKQGLEKHKISKEDLILIARDERYEIYDDKKKKKAIIIVAKGSRFAPKGYLFLETERPKRKLGWKLLEYVAGLSCEQSSLVPFVLKSKAMMRLVEYLYRGKSKSVRTLRSYARTIKQLCDYMELSPDELIESCLEEDDVPNVKKVHQMSKLVDEFLGELEAEDLALAPLR